MRIKGAKLKSLRRVFAAITIVCVCVCVYVCACFDSRTRILENAF